MMLGLTIALCVVIILVALAAAKLASTRLHCNILACANKELQARNDQLNLERLDNIRAIQQLQDEVHHLTVLNQQVELTKDQVLDQTKLAMIELTKDLHNQLTTSYQQHNTTAHRQAEHNVGLIADKFHTQFEKVLGMVSSLHSRVANTDSIVENIKNSLLHPISIGQLAEITLENILKDSGLKQDIDFIMQHHLLGDEQNRLRPDAVIFLPGNKLMIVDAKASRILPTLADGQIPDDDQLRKSIANHLKSLSSKEYHKALAEYCSAKGKQHRYIATLMFLPTEAAIERAMQADKDFTTKAWQHNIFVVGPIGLRNLLDLSRFHIADYDRQANYEAIFAEVTKLAEAISTVVEHSAKIGSGIQGLANHYDKFAASFNRSLIKRLDSLQHLGIGIAKKPQPIMRYQLTHFGNTTE